MVNKVALAAHFDSIAPKRPAWFKRNFIYHQQIIQACKPFLDEESRVLELGCSTGDLLAALKPCQGVGIDLSPESIAQAKAHYPSLNWIAADVEHLPDTPLLKEPFDLIVMADLTGYLDDIQRTLENLRSLCHRHTRLVISTWNWIWRPVLTAGSRLGLKAPEAELYENWLSPNAISDFLELAGYETVQTLPGVLLPYHIPILTALVNTLSHAPLLHRTVLLNSVVARPLPIRETPHVSLPSVSVIIPTRNEAGNIAALVERVPEMGNATELIFVDGNSSDGTVEKIHEQIAAHPERKIRFLPQVQHSQEDGDHPPDLMLKLGKGDAVRKGFAAATGDILLILDSDITVLPEELPRFYEVLRRGQARFVNGTRFVYPQADQAMRPLNRIGNVIFTLAFSWLLDQLITDTLCGTKGLFKQDYDEIAANRAYFGDFDPFGDFDLLFGAARLGFRILDIPIHYQARTYGVSKVRVGLHGPLLIRMSIFALWKLKLSPFLNRFRR